MMIRGKDFSGSSEIAEVIDKCVPAGADDFGHIGNEPVFSLCQYLKGIVPEGTVSDELHGVVSQWWDKSKSILMDHGIEDFTTVWIQFTDLWDTPGKIKHPKRDSFRTARGRAEVRLSDRPELSSLRDKKLIHLGHVCYELQWLNGDGPFFISGKDAGSVMGMCDKSGRLALKYLQRQLIIEKVKDGHTGRSAEYRYIGQAQNEERGKMAEQIRQYRETGDL